MTLTSHDWLKKIRSAMQEMTEIPLWGHPPAFPWEKCNEALARQLDLSDLRLELKSTEKRRAGHLLEGLGEAPEITPFQFSGLEGTGFWVLAKEDVSILCTQALHPEQRGKGFSDRRLQAGFYQFLCLEVLQTLNQTGAFEPLSVKMGAEKTLPTEDALCIDLSLHLNQRTLWGRVIIPEPLYHAFKAHFAEVKPLSIPKETAKNIDVTLSLEAGNATLTLGQWKQIERGDFLVLDRCSFDPVGHKGIVTIALEKTPLLKAKIKDNQIKILDYALYFEENPDTTMSYPDEEEPHEEEFFSEEEDVSNEEHVGEDKEESPTSVEHSAMEKMISANEIPVTVAVEVARVRMNLEKLIELQPGNVLELGVMPDVGVDLTINGKKVARGELVKLGEVLGVKILNLGG